APRVDGVPLSAARLVVIANYVFSGLRHDAYVMRAGRWHHALVRVAGRGDAADLTLAWRVGARAAAPYAEHDLNTIPRGHGGARPTLVPIGALRCLHRLAGIARDDLLVLAADRPDVGSARGDLGIGRHGAV